MHKQSLADYHIGLFLNCLSTDLGWMKIAIILQAYHPTLIEKKEIYMGP